MTRLAKMACVTLFAFPAALAGKADIVGLDPTSYQYNHADPGFPQVTSTSIQLSNGVNQFRSIVFYQPQNISQFNASFTYKATRIASCPVGQGMTFFLENDLRGVGAIGSSLGGLGYNGITPSAAVAFDLNTDIRVMPRAQRDSSPPIVEHSQRLATGFASRGPSAANPAPGALRQSRP